VSAVLPTDHGVWQRQSLQRHVVHRRDDGLAETLLLVEGLRCANCVLRLEKALTALPSVKRVRINAASRRARVVWADDRASLQTLLDCVERAGYQPLPLEAGALDDARRDESRAALKRLLVAGFGAMQAMMYASVLYVGAIDPLGEATRALFRWIGFLIAAPVVLYSAQPFFAGAMRALRARHLGMDVPIALAIAIVYGASLIAAISGHGEVYFDSVTMLVFFLLIGRYLEMRARHRALDLTDALARATPTVAQRREADGRLQPVAVSELRAGDRVQVDTGALVPADGVSESPACRVDESLLTGESRALERAQGEPLIAGSLVLDGPVTVRVERTGAETTLGGIAALVSRAQAERPQLARAGERAAAHFVSLVLVLATLTAVAWALLNPASGLTAVVAVLVVSCPCAFALAVPAAITRTLAVLADRGVLVTRPDAIEALAGATHVVFDKTGTLTDGLHLGSIELMNTPAGATGEAVAPDDPAAHEALGLAAALARESRHPISRAIAEAAGGRVVAQADAVESRAGDGVAAIVNGRRLRLGRRGFALAAINAADVAAASTWSRGGAVLADDIGPIAVFHCGERIRSGAVDAIASLRAQGMTIEIASGDAPARVAGIARQLGVDHWQGGLLPTDKLARLQELRAQGARVVAVGDGINDAPVLAGADVAVALADGTDMARAASDIIIAGERLDRLAESRTLAQTTLRLVRQNQRWAVCYNLIAIPLAATGFVPPWLAAIGMSASSLGVVLNVLRIGRRRSRHKSPSGKQDDLASA